MDSDTRGLRILITNDDGGRAPGLALLEEIAGSLSDDVWTVAPEVDQSGVSHAISLHEPLRVHRDGERRFLVRGTPADCVLLGVEHLIPGRKPDLVLSGVNRGGNMADAIAYSGTVGAAMTALSMDVRAIALSQLFRDVSTVHWDTARRFAPDLVRRLLAVSWPRKVMFNVNFPPFPPEEVRGIAFCRPAHGLIGGVRVEERVDVRQQTYHWISFRRSEAGIDDPDSDVVALRERRIAVTPLRPDRHAEPDWAEMAESHGDLFTGLVPSAATDAAE